MTTALEGLVGWALALSPSDVPPSAAHATRRHLLDGLGCARGAYRTGPPAGLHAITRLADAPADATVFGTGQRRPAHVAALANGLLVHALDFDDTHADALVHPTATVLPTALAVGEEVGADGATARHAATVGYEIVTRLGAAVRHGFHGRGFHATSVCGAVSSAIVAALLRGLPEAEVVNAAGIAASTSSGLLEFLATGSATKQVHPGWAAQAGIVAAALAADGVTGPASALEGEHGLYRAFTGTTVAVDDLLGDLGERWEVERITVKPIPACQLVHAPVDAVAEIRDQLTRGNTATDRVGRIVVDVPADSVLIVCEPVDDKRRPRSDYDARFSLPWCVAAALVDGRVDLDTFTDLDRKDLLAVADLVGYRVVDTDGPAAAAPGRVTVELDDGRTLTGHVPSSRGGPDRRLADDELVAKYLATSGETDDTRARAMLGLDDLPDLSPIVGGAL